MKTSKIKTYYVGDVVKLCDGLDYDSGNSCSYQDGLKTEILKIKDGRYYVYRFYRPVEKDEIEKLVYTNAQKQERFSKLIEKIGDIIWVTRNEENILVYKPYKIHGFDFEYEEYMIEYGKRNLCRSGTDGPFSELEAWKRETMELRDRIKKIREIA